MKGFERFNRSLSGWGEALALGAVLFMVALTCVDVLGAKLWRLPVPGSLDMMMLAQLIAVSAAGAMTLVERRHVAVEFFVARLSERAQAAIDAVVQLAGLALFAVVVWRLADYGLHLQAGGETTPTAHIPLAPFAYAAAVALLPLCLVLAQNFLAALGSLRR